MRVNLEDCYLEHCPLSYGTTGTDELRLASQKQLQVIASEIVQSTGQTTLLLASTPAVILRRFRTAEKRYDGVQ